MLGTVATALIGFIPSVFKAATDSIAASRAVKAAKEERKHELTSKALDVKLEAIRRGSESDMKMDEEADTRISWADDLTLIVFLIPCLLAFCPPALPGILAGFAALELMPTWYQYSLGLMLISVWGYRRVFMPVAEAAASVWAKRLK